MGQEVVGLKIGASQLTAAHVEAGSKGKLLAIGSAPVTAGAVGGGEVRDVELLASNISNMFGQTTLPRKAVRIGLASNRIGVRTVEIDGIAEAKQLANAIRFRAQEALPIPLDEAILDFQVLGQTTGEDGQPCHRVQFVVAYRELVNGFVEACRKADLHLVGVDLDAFAMLRALARLGPGRGDAGATVAVSLGAERSTIAVTGGRICEFTRVLDWGGSTLDRQVADHLDISMEEAEALKIKVGLGDDSAPEGVEPEMASQVRASLTTGVEAFARDLVASLQFYQSQPASQGIAEVLLAGGTARLAGFAHALERMVGVAVRVGNPLGNLQSFRKGLDPDPSLAVPIGLGLGV
ncbi:MAG: type IV pilus assembly protein PilM [Gaiellales bacterium]